MIIDADIVMRFFSTYYYPLHNASNRHRNPVRCVNTPRRSSYVCRHRILAMPCDWDAHSFPRHGLINYHKLNQSIIEARCTCLCQANEWS